MKILLATLLLALAACSKRPGLPVRFVVPDGYRGLVTVTLDPSAGVAVPVSNGQFVVSIPPSGKVSVSSFDFLKGKHLQTAQYVSGAPVNPSHDSAAVGVRLVTVTPDFKTAMYMVGTEKEEEVARQKELLSW